MDGGCNNHVWVLTRQKEKGHINLDWCTVWGRYLIRERENGPVLMRKVKSGHETESKTGHSVDLESFLMSSTTAGHEIQSEAGVPFSLFTFQPHVTCHDLAHSE